MTEHINERHKYDLLNAKTGESVITKKIFRQNVKTFEKFSKQFAYLIRKCHPRKCQKKFERKFMKLYSLNIFCVKNRLHFIYILVIKQILIPNVNFEIENWKNKNF